MSNLTKRASKNSDPDPEREREREALARREAGIELLTEDEELIDDATFSKMHARLAVARQDGEDEEEVSAASEEQRADELLLEEIATELPVERDAPVVTRGPATDPSEVAALERELLAAKSRDEVAELSLRIARYYTQVVALFVVNRGLIAGLSGAGSGLEERIEGIVIPTTMESLIAQPVETGKLARGCAPVGAVDQRLLRALGRGNASEIAIIPIPIGQRVVNLLYADNGADPLPETSVGALRVLCGGVAHVYQRLILERKQAANG